MGLTLLVIAIAVAVVVALSLQAKKRDEAWETAGRRLGLTFRGRSGFQGRKLEGECVGHAVRVDTYSRRSGKQSQTYTRYRIGYADLGLGLNLEREGLFSGVKKFFGAQDIEVGDPGFDEGILVKGDHPTAVRAYLTPARRLVVQRALSKFDGLSIADSGMEFSRSGLDGESRIVGTVKSLCGVATELAGDSDVESRLGQALVAQEDGRMEEALSLVDEAAEDAAEDNAEAQVVRGEILMTLGRREEALEALEQLPRERREAPEVEALIAELPEITSEPPTSEPTGQAKLAESAAEVCAALFVPGRMSTETSRDFDERYTGREVRWTGKLQRVETYYSDLVFGSGRGTRARFLIHTVEGRSFGSGEVQAVVQLPLDAAETLRDRIGDAFTLTGRLVRCDPFMRNLFIAEGAVSS